MTAPVLERVVALLADAREGAVLRAPRPSIAIVVPSRFEADDPLHARELEVALDLAELLAVDHRPRLVSEASALRDVGAEPLTDERLRELTSALVVMDRALARRVSEHLPTRLVGTDTLAHDPRKRRTSFFDMRASERGFSFLAPNELPSRLRGREVALVVDPFVSPETVELLAEAARRDGATVRVLGTPTSPALRAGTAEPYPGPESLGPEVVVVATNPLLVEVHAKRHETLLVDERGRYATRGDDALPAHEHLLYLGEAWNPLRLRERLVAPLVSRSRPRAPSVTEPLVSVVVPVYDRVADLLRLGDSVLSQDYRNLELVFVTNGSPPTTLEALRLVGAKAAARRIACRRIDFPEAFGCATVPRDVGSYAASGEFILYLDSDDYLAPDFFGFARSRPLRRDTIYYPRRIFRNLGRRLPAETPMDVVISYKLPRVDTGLFELLSERGNFLNNSGTMISREWFERAGGIAHDFRYCEDYYLWLRLAHLGACAEEHDGVVNIVFHRGNNELVVGDPRWIALAKARSVEPGAP